MAEQVFTNARIVTRDSVIPGSLVLRDGRIAEIGDSRSSVTGAEDLDGDLLIPGLIELHTDNLEKHVAPRPGVWWPGVTAMVAHDAQVAAGGITTVFDALTLGDRYRTEDQGTALGELVAGVREATDRHLLRVEHRLHLRCEVSFGQVLDLLDPLIDAPDVGLISLMDHTPGERQFADVEKYKEIYRLGHHMTEAEVDVHLETLQDDQRRYSDNHRRAIVARAQARGQVLASHDDSCRAHVEQAHAERVAIAEFPTTDEAAEAAGACGLKVLMGAPNLLRGASHSGNIAAGSLAKRGRLDILSSDYYPASLLIAAFHLSGPDYDLPLPDAIAVVTANPADAVGLADRGRIAVGRRGDLVRVRAADGLPLVRGVWRAGTRVA